jgi:energy-converting hydrogenase B subunit N
MIGGNRVQYGVPVIGGIRPRADLNEMRIQKIKEGMDHTEEKITEFADRFTRDPMIMSRITGVAALSKEDALRLSATGPTLRSTGVAVDLRRDMKQYDPFEFDVITQDDGDVKSNLLMHVLEIFESIKIIRQAIKDLPEGKITNRSWEMHDTDIIRNYIEVPRGKLYHSYRLEDGRLRNSIIRTPSITNINAMEHACIGTHITDAQLAIVQCDPCFTCTDRAIQIVDHPLKKNRII